MAGMKESEWMMARRDGALLALGFELRGQVEIHRRARNLQQYRFRKIL